MVKAHYYRVSFTIQPPGDGARLCAMRVIADSGQEAVEKFKEHCKTNPFDLEGEVRVAPFAYLADPQDVWQ
jgi:hypothetical protein